MAQILGDEQPKRRKLDTASSSAVSEAGQASSAASEAGQASSAASGPSLGLDPAAVARLQAQRDLCEKLLSGWADNFENRCDDIQEALDALELDIEKALPDIVEPEDLNQFRGAELGAYLGFWKDAVSQSSIDLKRFKELVKEHLDVEACVHFRIDVCSHSYACTSGSTCVFDPLVDLCG